MTENVKKQYLTVRAGNAKRGTAAKSGKPWVKIGLVVKSGARKGEWVNYFKIVTDKTKPYLLKDLEAMGVTDIDNFTCDGRLVTAVWGWDDFYKEERVIGILPSKFQPDIIKADAGTHEDDSEVF